MEDGIEEPISMTVPIGSAASEECKIDSISQSWSVISGAGRSQGSEKL